MSFDIEQFKVEGLKDMQSVMPASWDGHARIESFEQGLSDKQTEFVIKLSERIVEKHGVDYETARAKAVEQAKEKLN